MAHVGIAFGAASDFFEVDKKLECFVGKSFDRFS
jgi:hypothetical protein